MSSENMSEEECSPSKFPRLTVPLRDIRPLRYSTESKRFKARRDGLAKASARSYAEQINNQFQCNGRCSSNITVKVAILADGWGCWSWQGSNVHFTTELSKQLAKFPYMKVSLLVPEGSCESLSRETKLRSVLAEMEDVCQCDVQPILQMADLTVGLGPKIAGRLSDSLTRQGKEVFKLTPGTLTEFADITQTLRDREKFRILVAGHGYLRYFYKERLEIVAKAVAKLKDESYEIIFVGAAEGEHRGFMKKFRKCGVPKHQMIIRSPPKDEEEMKSWLCEADLAIVPSDEQEFGMFGLAALSSGLPILVHGASGLGEALRYVDGGRLSIVKSEDISEWSKAIKTVRDLERTVRLDEADLLRKHYNEKYSWEKQCGDLVEEMLKMASAQQGKTQ